MQHTSTPSKTDSHQSIRPGTPIEESVQYLMSDVLLDVDIGNSLAQRESMLPLARLLRRKQILFVLGEADQVSETEQCHQHRQDSLQDENPSPPFKTSNAIHSRYAVCQGSAESARERSSGKEDRYSSVLLFP